MFPPSSAPERARDAAEEPSQGHSHNQLTSSKKFTRLLLAPFHHNWSIKLTDPINCVWQVTLFLSCVWDEGCVDLRCDMFKCCVETQCLGRSAVMLQKWQNSQSYEIYIFTPRKLVPLYFSAHSDNVSIAWWMCTVTTCRWSTFEIFGCVSDSSKGNSLSLPFSFLILIFFSVTF